MGRNWMIGIFYSIWIRFKCLFEVKENMIGFVSSIECRLVGRDEWMIDIGRCFWVYRNSIDEK